MYSPILRAIFLILICCHPVLAQSTGILSGLVLDKQTQKPIYSVNLSLTGTSYVSESDPNGNFIFPAIPVGTYSLEASFPGYQNQTLFNIVVSVGNEYHLTIELDPNLETLNEVVIRTNKRTVKAATLENPLSVQRLTSEEIKANPGGNFDISKVIQTLPGVGGGQSGGSFRNDIIIRGGAPNENVFYLDGIEIPVLNHFQTQGSSGGPQGMLNVSFIEDVKVSTSAFDARYDNAMSSVFQFKQKNGNPNKLQGNTRLSATELALTLDGPLSKDKKTTFLFSARRSYLQLLFSLIDLPIRPNYWDFQTKITKKIDDKTTLSFIGLSGIDEFKFARIKDATPEKLYVLNSNPIINQWNYTIGVTLKRLITDGYLNVAISRNSFDNSIKQYENNDTQLNSELTLNYASRETENKLRIEVTQSKNGLKFSYGTMAQYIDYSNSTYNVIRKQLIDDQGTIVQPATIVQFSSPLDHFWRFGVYAQASARFFENRFGISAGLRNDVNTVTDSGTNPLKTLSPRLSFSYTLTDNVTLNASIGRYFKLPTYTVLGFAENNALVNKSARYLQSDHYVAGIEFVPDDALRFTIEGFYKQYANVPVSLRNGIALSNLGNDFTVLGNEAITTDGKGRAYGVEFFVQKKLTKRFFGILSYTLYRSEYSGLNNQYVASSWDNRHLLSITCGYKLPKNWELGMKFRYQGPAPYTPFDETASRLNYQTLGQGVLDYSRINALRLNGFNSSDVRIDKKWNFNHLTLDLYLDVTNWYAAESPASDSYTFKRNADNSAFLTTDDLPIKADGSNAIPTLLKNNDPVVTPTIGFILEF